MHYSALFFLILFDILPLQNSELLKGYSELNNTFSRDEENLTFDVCRFSVEVTRNDDVTSRGAKSAESRVSGEGGEATCGQDKEGGRGEGEKKQLPMYTFTPVDRFGDNKGEMERLQDLGMAKYYEMHHYA